MTANPLHLILLAAVLALLPATAPHAQPPAEQPLSAFYTPPSPIPSRPGQILRTEALPANLAQPGAGTNLRILYSSTDGLDGATPIAISGALFLPPGNPPQGGWPLVAWARGTVGVANACAPSWSGRDGRDIEYLDHWLAQGYAIVATDYQGLGTPGPHPYIAARPAAYGVLDSIRAAQSGAWPVSGRAVIIGQSQGGGAAFSATATARFYAPELDIRGTVATGTPFFDPARPVPAAAEPEPDSGLPKLGFSLLLLDLAERRFADFRAEEWLTPTGIEVLRLFQAECFPQAAAAIAPRRLTMAHAFRDTRVTTPVWMRLYPLFAFDTLRLPTPLFMGIGGVDEAVPAEGQLRLRQAACAAGSRIEAHLYPSLDHSGAVNGSLRESTPFVARAFAGQPNPGNCAGFR